jgi:hypothetical protein
MMMSETEDMSHEKSGGGTGNELQGMQKGVARLIAALLDPSAVESL